FALRMGYLDEKNGEWKFKNPSIMKDLLDNKIAISDLKDEHFIYYAKQKGVDMKIGIDIARLSFQKIVEKIVLISGDSDFVPAAKLTRTEGLHFTLDPMGNNIKSDLQEHIDWLHTTLPNH
ncbi:NYN domain-containing protein, partial [Helicobacter ganmani]|uniref:NYN domain-containing protein n=1 Tax=Helicobacter ganmani TaxID=60246 RepID=UPI003A87C7A9